MNYAALDGPSLLKELGTDAGKWAEAFCQIHPGHDEGLMISWFANSMMAMHDKLTGQGPIELPDGSGFAIGTI